jgi:hypothetical protein
LVIRFKDINNRYFKKQIEHKKGIFENEFTFNTGTHKYINHFTFSQPQPNSIGVIKNVYSENNNSVIWNKPNTNFSFDNTFSSVYQSYDDIIEIEEENTSDIYNYYTATYTRTGFLATNQPCYCRWYENYFTIKVKILDYHLNGKIPFVFLGRYFGTTKTINVDCFGNKTLYYFELEFYIISSDGQLPSGNILFVDYAGDMNWCYSNQTYLYLQQVQRKLDIYNVDLYGYCQMLKNKGIPRSEYSAYPPFIHIWVSELGNNGNSFIDACAGDYIQLWNVWKLWNNYMDAKHWGNVCDTYLGKYKINFPSGEYITIGVLEKKMNYICIP